MTMPKPTVSQAHVTLLRVYDVANTIDLDLARWILCKPGAEGALACDDTVFSLARAAPLCVHLRPVMTYVQGQQVMASVAAHFYDFGVLAISLVFSIVDMPWSQFAEHVRALDQHVMGSASESLWQAVLGDLLQRAHEALFEPNQAPLMEDYVTICIHAFGTRLAGQQISSELDLPSLLSGEPYPLSSSARRHLLRHRFAHDADELIVVTRDRALICQSRHESQLAGMLEAANAQLLELRYYDQLLTGELTRIYGLVVRTQHVSALIAPRRMAELARRLHALVAEVSELTGRMDMTLQLTGNIFLTRIYEATLALFGVPDLRGAVDRKLANIRDTYTALYDEASASRANMLEVAIVILIALEILLALIRR